MAVISSTALTGITTRMADAAMSAGSILQFKHGNKTDQSSTGSTSYQDTGLQIAVTPSSASNKIFLLADVAISWDQGTARGSLSFFKDSGSTPLLRGDQDPNNANNARDHFTWYIDTVSDQAYRAAITYLDSPNTTSEVTYKVKFRNNDGNGTVYINRATDVWGNHTYVSTNASSFTLMEVAA